MCWVDVWVALVALVFGAAPATHPVVAGAQVGFWASQTLQPCPPQSLDPAYCPRNLASYTPEVWDALEETGGSLYLNVMYGSDYGVTPPKRTDAIPLIREANRRGIVVHAWITVPIGQGTFANENNGELMGDAVRALPGWAEQNGLTIGEAVLDLEFPAGYQAVTDLLAGVARNNIDPKHQCEAIATYRETIEWAHAHGVKLSASPVPFALDDLFDGTIALQDALDITAFPPIGYDVLYLQAYRSYANSGPWYVSQYYKQMQQYFGASGQITIGDVALGTPPYDSLGNLVKDVRMLVALGATTIPVYDLDGVVRSFGAEGVRAIVEAGDRPLSKDALKRYTEPDLESKLQRTFFRTLDIIATALSRGTFNEPNAYPFGCT